MFFKLMRTAVNIMVKQDTLGKDDAMIPAGLSEGDQ